MPALRPNQPGGAETRPGTPACVRRALTDGYDRLVAVARQVLRDEEEARDAVQDACVAALRSGDAFGHRAQPSTWLYRIVVNAALMRHRRRRRRGEESLDDQLATAEPREPVPAAEDVVGNGQLRAMLRRAVASLPEQHRRVLELRDLQELDTGETAEALGLTPNAAKIRLHRARRALRATLDPMRLEATHA
jgi:RNA polymerase sigma-70 factor (ECF subfamily)